MNRTTTVLAADVAGYTRMLAEDEPGTIAALESVRDELLLPGAGERGGQVIRLTGDGSLVEFPSVSAAVDFAFALLSQLEIRNSDGSDRVRLAMRIGIHHGELNPGGLEPHGEAINIAVRLQEIAEPNGLAVSGVVHALLGNRANRMLSALGERMLRNIADPVAVWTWLPSGRSDADVATASKGERSRASGRQILDRRVSDLLVDLHMRSSRMAVSDAFDTLLTTRPEGRSFTLQEVFAVMGEQLNLSRSLLAPVRISLIDDHAQHISDAVDEQSMNEYIRRVFNNSRTAFAMELLPRIGAILDSDATIMDKRRQFLALVDAHQLRMAELSKRLIKHAFVDLA